MTQRQQLIRKLLTTFHLNTVDRQEFKEEPINIKEVKEVIKQDLKNKQIFPDTASIWTNGQQVFEGHFLEKISDSKYKLHWQRHQAINPYQLAESHEETFEDLGEAIDEYMKREFSYNIDGLKINIC